LPLGFPVGFTLMGVALLFSLIGHLLGAFDLPLLTALPQRLIGLMENDLLQAIPLFVYLGVIMQRTTLAAELLEAMSGLFGARAGGLSISTVILGALLAPTTGAVGASVLTLGLLALPAMLAANYRKSLACGVVCSAGTLGTVLPPSIILIVLADLMRGANAEAQIIRGEDVHGALTIRDIYVAMLGPVGILLALYLLYVIGVAIFRPAACPPPAEMRPRLPLTRLFVVVIGPLAFIALLLASIGLHGLTSYAVARRTSEIGIRLALGAQRSQVLWLVLRQVLALAAAGLALGIPLAWAGGPLVASYLFGVAPRDVLTVALAGLVLTLVTLVAGWLPARRAARMDPLAALRVE